jgi:hypothetical protein
MGHIRLGALPRTRKWAEVVALIACGAGAVQVANAAIRAAERDLGRAKDEAEVVWLLTQLPLAARPDPFAKSLRRSGPAVSDEPGVMEVIAAFADAVDGRLANNRGRTDLGEMAQMAAAETLAADVGERTRTMFGTSPEEVRAAFADPGTVKQFGAFARRFFARLTAKTLDYFLSRVLMGPVGDGLRFVTLAQQAAFTDALETHCREASAIVERFAGEWLSKTNWENKGIDRDAAARFAAYALDKLVADLREGAQPDAA